MGAHVFLLAAVFNLACSRDVESESESRFCETLESESELFSTDFLFLVGQMVLGYSWVEFLGESGVGVIQFHNQLHIPGL